MTVGVDTADSDIFLQTREVVQRAAHIVVFTGAGMSAESGIPTFRDAMTGLWSRFSAEALATEEAFRRDPETVWGWYEWRRSKAMSAAPHAGHLSIADFACRHDGVTLITQNVDNLHERAGFSAPLHLHGSLFEPRCLDCRHAGKFDVSLSHEAEDGYRMPPPRCEVCGGMLRPGVVWFGESLPENAWQLATEAVKSCDLMICIGTSGLVYPAASLPVLAVQCGAMLIQINIDKTSLDCLAHFNLHGSAENLLPLLLTNG